MAGGAPEESLGIRNRAAMAGAGTFDTSNVAISMIEREIKGSILNIRSLNAWQGCAGVIAYAFHKGGLANFTRAAAMDLAPYGIRAQPELAYGAEARHPATPQSCPSPAGVRVCTVGEHASWWRDPGKIDVRGNMPMAPSTPTTSATARRWPALRLRPADNRLRLRDRRRRAGQVRHTPPSDRPSHTAASPA